MLKVGDKIGRYKVTKEINVGGFCNSYFVSDPAGSYFLKEYGDPRESDPLFKAFFDNQCIIIERLNKMASIAEKYVDHFIENGTYYQVKAKLTGMDLDTYLSTPRDYEILKELSIIICGVIKNLHSQRIVHQDLKPAQIMLVDDELGKKTKLGYRIVLSDFDWSIPDGKVVQIVGTLMYKSPEHYRNETPVFESDNFTLGIMIYQFFTGRNPFDFDDYAGEDDLRKRVLNGKIFAPPKKINHEIPDDVNNMISRCLVPDPHKRPAIDEIQSALLGITSKTDGTPPAAVKSSVTPPAMTAVSKPTASSGWGKFSISSAGHNMIIYSEKEIGRQDFKLFFSDITDKSGNPVHKYCDETQIMLKFTKGSDGNYCISAPNSTKNYFLMNSIRIGKENIKLKLGDKLELFSTSKSEVVGSFLIQS